MLTLRSTHWTYSVIKKMVADFSEIEPEAAQRGAARRFGKGRVQKPPKPLINFLQVRRLAGALVADRRP